MGTELDCIQKFGLKIEASLSAEDKDGVDQTVESAKRRGPNDGHGGGVLHSARALFFDPGIYQREKELIFFKNWWFVGHVSELPEPGSYLTCQIFDQSILLIRGADNVIRAFYNVCTHRAYELVQGRGNARSFVCAYHAWSFDTKGCLRSANHESYVKGFRKSDYNLPEVKVCELGKFIYVNLDPNAADLNELASGFAQECRDAIPGYDDLQFIRRDRFEVKANWKVVIDNFLAVLPLSGGASTVYGLKGFSVDQELRR